MDGFLDRFFPSVKAREAEVPTVNNLYCTYNSQTLQLMTSSLFIAGAVCELSGTTGAEPAASCFYTQQLTCSTC